MRNFHYPGRSNVLSTKGIAATSHPLASQEALSILKMGGNAIDAAIAASAVLCVVEPNATSIGGDCFAIIAPKGKNPVSYNGSGINPEKAELSYFIKNNIKKIELESPHSVTIPGAIKSWESMHLDYGKLDFEKLFIKAIEYAEDGFAITEKVAENWRENAIKLNKNINTKKIFLKNGKSYKFAEKHKNPALANTLKRISKKGSKEFYNSDITEDIVQTLNELGGLHTIDDFNMQKTIKSKTIFSPYKDTLLHQCPPNGPGITVLIMMKMMENYEIKNFSPMSFERFHLEAEITKLSYKLREERIGDPNFNELNLEEILSSHFLDNLIDNISMDSCHNVGNLNIPAHPETVYLTVVDKDLNLVSFINSVCYAFGSGITTNKTGILLQNRGVNFRIEENHPNSIDSLKRPLHTIIPGMVFNKEGEAIISYGVMGGQFQPVGHTHFLNNVIDYEMTVQEAIDFPRGFHFNNQYQLELGVSNDVEKKLNSVGHKTVRTKSPHGGGQAIKIDYKEGVLIGGSDPRKDGCALGL